MSFRRVPFKFTTTDPVERQRELERRFGLPSSKNMLNGVDNQLSTGILTKESATSSSPRLQHRVPIFVEGYDQPVHSSVDSMGATSESKKSKVRVIPIEIEGSESRPSSRHRANSAGVTNDNHVSRKSDTPPLKRPMIHNIPIQVESTLRPKFEKISKSPQKDNSPKIPNGCTVSKSKTKSPVKEPKRKPETIKGQGVDIDKQEVGFENSLKEIEGVLEEFKTYEAQVHEFSGNTKDKKYRYLDEMLTRCMLKLDDVETMGNDSVRSSRKNAVKKIQACIDLLENKANGLNEVVNNPVSENEVKMSEIQETSETSAEICEESSACQTGVEMKEGQTTEAELPEDTQKIVSEVVVSQDATNIREQPSAAIPSEVPEVEMADLKTASSQNLNSNAIEINEVEMVSPSKPNIDSDNTFPIDEETEKIPNTQISTISQEDIEMKESVAENAVNCISSNAEEKCRSDMNIEKNITSENQEMSLCSGDFCRSDAGTCDSDIKM